MGLPHTRISQFLASSLIFVTFTTCGEPKLGPAGLGVGEVLPGADMGSKA